MAQSGVEEGAELDIVCGRMGAYVQSVVTKVADI